MNNNNDIKYASTFRIGDSDTWVISIPLLSNNTDEEGIKVHDSSSSSSTGSMAVHTVFDNSGSMGYLTKQAQLDMAPLVDEIAAKTLTSAFMAPCYSSMTVFGTEATLLSDKITSSAQVVALADKNPSQGCTNIPDGVRKGLQSVIQQELLQEQQGLKNNKTHHVLILLSDGAHNTGPEPHREFPKIGQELRATIPNVQLSVVVVGVTNNSSTRMGMQLKTCIETVPLNDVNGNIEQIFFAKTRADLTRITQQLVDGLSQVTRASSVYTVSCAANISGDGDSWKIIADMTAAAQTQVTLRKSHAQDKIVMLYQTNNKTNEPPASVLVNDRAISIQRVLPDLDLVAELLEQHIQKARVQRVAASTTNETAQVRATIQRIQDMIDALEKERNNKIMKEGGQDQILKLAKATGVERLRQHRLFTRTMHQARELRNQLAAVANFSSNNSSKQAAFLNGKSSKFADKAMSRAAKRSSGGGDGILDEAAELDKVKSEVTSTSFQAKLGALLQYDVLNHLFCRLSNTQLDQLESRVQKASPSDAGMLKLLMRRYFQASVSSADSCTEEEKKSPEQELSYLDGLSPEVRQFVDGGKLAMYLNDTFIGQRQSYLSLSNPWEHMAEWRCMSESNNHNKNQFQSQWEMLLFAGSLAYPISVERCAGAQMNPFLLNVKKIHATPIDSASLCCANHSQVDAYGPEGGEPIRDALVLVDPSCPQSSTMIAASRLLGETFTSVTVSRDLHMYSGSAMKIALHGKSMFRALQPEPVQQAKSDIVAGIRRQFMHRAYQCAECGFGPVDHGGCSDLLSHDGEFNGQGGVASNACPACGWFSEYLDGWDKWDGTVHNSMIAVLQDGAPLAKRLATKMDLSLRIIYSFRKIFFRTENTVKQFYDDLGNKITQWDLAFTTQDDIDGMVQVLLAMASSEEVEDSKAVEAAFAPPVVLAIINEVCARASRKKFRMASTGDENKAMKLAVERVTSMLHVTPESAPQTSISLLDPEPPREQVAESCSRDYTIAEDCDAERHWVRKVAENWCAALQTIKAMRESIIRWGGGWKKLECDMETSLESYQDVVEAMRDAEQQCFVQMCGLEASTLNRTLTSMAAQAFLYNKGSSRQNLPDVTTASTLADIARDMRMNIYFERVSEKMSQWVSQGEELAFAKARAADIGQYLEMVQAERHVHGLSKEMFWGLWRAALSDGRGGEKVKAFLATANDQFICSVGFMDSP